MTRSSASKSYGHCSSGSTVSRRPCGAAKSCPVSDGFADKRDTFCEEVSRHQASLDAVFVRGCIPTACLRERRKTPASAAHHKVLYTSHAGEPVFDTSTDQLEGEPPAVRTRRRQLSGHPPPASLRICESVFFRPKAWVVAFLPRLCASQPNFTASQNLPKRLQTNRVNNPLLDEIFT